ncbi:MAG TPA: hypothetical protein PKY96_12715 [Flavobacteriales bacterium]|nr:hypothetical protein [Flavobacteriales bacterium]
MKQSVTTNKPATIKQVGLVVAIIGALIVLSNSSGALMHTMMGADIEFPPPPHGSPTFGLTVDVAFNNYLALCLTMVAIGAVYLIGGIFLRQYKRWANLLVTALTALLILSLWWMSIGLSNSMRVDPMVMSFAFFPYIVAIAITIPLGLLVRFLNRKGIREHFD